MFPSLQKNTKVNDMQEGHGKEEWADGSVFEGEFQSGAKHGRGQFIWSTLCRYEGANLPPTPPERFIGYGAMVTPKRL